MLLSRLLNRLGARSRRSVHLRSAYRSQPRLERLEVRSIVSSAIMSFAIQLILVCRAFSGFGAPVVYGAHDVPISVAVGDLNGDGFLDLAVANYSSHDVSILLGNGDGTFQTAVNYRVGHYPRAVALGDFNGDGFLDVVVANSLSNDVSILPGNGDGTFQRSLSYSIGFGSEPWGIAAADLNKDGNLDIVTVNVLNWTVSVLLGNGDGTFQPARVFFAGQGACALTVGDFNGDGFPDLAVANSTFGVSVLLNNSDGTFQLPLNHFTDKPTESAPIAVADFNNDGLLDLAVSTNDGYDAFLMVMAGNGDGTLQDPVYYPAHVGSPAVAVADFNGDGALDILTTSMPTGIADLFLGNGDGSFRPGMEFATLNFLPTWLAIGDFNGDSFPDFVVTDSGVSVLLNDGIW